MRVATTRRGSRAQRVGGANRTVVVLSVLLAVAIILAFASFLHGERWADYGEQYLLTVAAQQNRTQQLVKEAGDAVRAKEVAFEQLATLRRDRGRFHPAEEG
jgi:uncharacterized protein HemX